VLEQDLPRIFAMHGDPVARHMAASQRPLEDFEAFSARWHIVMLDPNVTMRVLEIDGALAGFIGTHRANEVGYWIDTPFWGQGHASWALAELLTLVAVRPLYAHVAQDNVGSCRVLEKCGFKRLRAERSYSVARQADVDDWVYELT
jgi:RimJ/RimL family protein N-acetyltransferase